MPLALAARSSSLALPSAFSTALSKSNRVSADNLILSAVGFGVAAAGAGAAAGAAAGAPAQAGAAAGDDVATVDHVGNFTLAIHHDVFYLGKDSGCGEADRGDGGQCEHLLFGLFDHNFLVDWQEDE